MHFGAFCSQIPGLMPDLPKKSITVEIAVPSAASGPFFLVNHASIVRDGAFTILFFGYQGPVRTSPSDFAVAISDEDFASQRDNLEGYFAQIADLEPDAELQPWMPSSVEKIYCANILQLSRRGRVADTTFCVYPIHDAAHLERRKPKTSGAGSQDKFDVAARVIYTLRSTLALQVALLHRLIKP